MDKEERNKLLDEAIVQYADSTGEIPPPWVFRDQSHPYQMGWRMGEGEFYLMVFWKWWDKQGFSIEERINYFKKHPAPPRWMAWKAEAIWDLNPWESPVEFDFTPYFDMLKAFGFAGVDAYEKDLNDEKWLM